MDQDEQAIRELIASWNERSQKGEVERVLELMTDDIVFTVVGRPPFGKREFAESARQMKGLKLDTQSEVIEVVVRGDTAWSRVRLSVVVNMPNGGTVRRDGHAMSIFVKQPDGRWLMTRDANMLGPPT